MRSELPRFKPPPKGYIIEDKRKHKRVHCPMTRTMILDFFCEECIHWNGRCLYDKPTLYNAEGEKI